MEKIAIISDIHGNITALKAVIKDIKEKGIKRIFCLGDMLIKCSEPRECVETVLKECEVVIQGNCELRVTTEPIIDEHFWNKDKLSKNQIDIIKNLPLSYDFYMSGYKIRLIHASPYSVREKANYWKFDKEFPQRFERMFDNTEYLNNIDEDIPDIVIFGHIHKHFLYRIKDKMIINPGAVSNSSEIICINGENYCYGSYLIIEGEFNSRSISQISYKFVKFTYDYIKEANNILNSNMPNKEKAYEEIHDGKYFNRKNLNEEAVRN